MSQEPRPERRLDRFREWLSLLLSPDVPGRRYHADGRAMVRIIQAQQARGEWKPNPRWTREEIRPIVAESLKEMVQEEK